MSTPWDLSSSAVDYLSVSCSSKVAIEFGSGEGTEYLVRSGFMVYSIESSAKWISPSVQRTLLSPIQNRWYDHEKVSEYINSTFLNNNVGAVIIDGPIGSIGRWGALYHWSVLDKAEIILVDDTDREEEFALACCLALLTKRSQVTLSQDGKSFTFLQ